MTYTPINEHVFAAAMSGALSGIGIGERPITSTVSADYSGLALAAFAYAEEFDTQWATTAIDELIWGAINTASCNYFENRNKLSIAPVVYTNEVAAIIAAIKEGDAIAIEGGATIPAWPPGGGGSGTVTDVTATAPLTVSNPTTTPNLALTAPVADWQGNTATINVTGTAAVALTSNFTPAVSGKMDVIISGVLECAESSVTDHPFTIGISQGAGPSSGVYELATIPHVQNAATGGTPGSTTFSLVCSLDKIAVVGPPVTFTVGVAAILNAVVVGDNSGQMTIPAKGLQMKVQERFV